MVVGVGVGEGDGSEDAGGVAFELDVGPIVGGGPLPIDAPGLADADGGAV
jgi:hypothetical protein